MKIHILLILFLLLSNFLFAQSSISNQKNEYPLRKQTKCHFGKRMFYTSQGREIKPKLIKILNEKLVIKQRHTYFKNKELSLNIFRQANKRITISVYSKFINEYTNIDNFSLIITDTLGNEKKFFHSYGNILNKSNKIRNKPNKTKTKATFNNKNKVLRIKLPIRFYSKNSVSSFTEEYKLKKGKYFLYIKFKEDGNVFMSNRVPLFVK
jgi:hypothetical protein